MSWISLWRRLRSARPARPETVDPARMLKMSRSELHALLAGDPAEAARWVRAAAERGFAAAQVRLGRILLDGAGLPKNEEEALAWFRTAARGHDADGMNMVGRCYENGWGIAPDPAMAAEWYRKAAEAGDSWGQYNLGHMLLDGNGVAADAPRAFVWYRKAADQGHARAMNLVARCLEHGWGVERDAEAARRWYRASAQGGCFRGQYNWATILRADGRLAEAEFWFRAAAEHGTPSVRRAVERQRVTAFSRRLTGGIKN
jgi:TPR repeat protein